MASEDFSPSRETTDPPPYLPGLVLEPDSCSVIGVARDLDRREESADDRGPAMADSQPVAMEDLPLMRLLVVNENTEVRSAFCEVASCLGFLVDETGSAVTAREILVRNQTDILLVDVTRPESGAQSLLEEMKALCPETLVIVMSARATIASAVDTMRLGVCDYLSEPFPLHVLSESLRRAAKRRHFNVERQKLQETLSPEARMADVLGRSTEMEKLYRILSRVADSSHPAMIIGEDGTGKLRVAMSIHSNGPHAAKPFVSLDCKTLGSALLEGELFGHVKGAFSGARREKRGLLASSQGGTLFLNEIGDISLELQAKLMKALREKEVFPLGGTKAVPISVRILAASNRDLTEMVTAGRFRMDLFQLLSVVNLRIPPLRGRPGDIAFLAKRFLEKIKHQSGNQRTLSEETLRILESYDWPENVRELEQSIVRACSESSAAELRASDLPQEVLDFHRKRESNLRVELLVEEATDVAASVAEPTIVSIAQVEQRAILEALRQTKGDKWQTAQLLGIGKTTLDRRLKEYGLGKEGRLVLPPVAENSSPSVSVANSRSLLKKVPLFV
jgi:DNA-binding NtrC family response regulator